MEDATLPSTEGDREGATAPARENTHALTVVGIGGSAGCIPALQVFFQNVTAKSRSAYVVVLHLSPEHESHLVEILERATSLPVQQVSGPVHLRERHIYVIPPGKHLRMQDGMILLSDPEALPGRRVAIDTFFRTLAHTHGPQAVAVVLSGTGADGTLGLRQIKEAGGLAVAQAPGEAEFDPMPRSAIATGMVDHVLPVATIPDQIDSYWETSRQMRLPEEGAPSPEQRDDGPEPERALQDILEHVQAQTGHDFAYYKRATVLRRIGRRMQVNRLQTLPLYRDFLRSHPAEVGDLISDLLISVTQFFRDKKTWELVELEVIPRLFEGKEAHDEVRAWVCACATGEEAFTLAMLLLEYAERLPHAPRVQVFATDMDADAIARARAGVYPETIAGDLPEERLKRWFYRQNGLYQVRKEVRECVLFATHDVLRDTPFSRLDLITCRNLLIYLNKEAQERVFTIFHFALRPEGRLLLGSSESADVAEGLFTIANKQHRLYLRRSALRGTTPPIAVLPAFPTEILLPPLAEAAQGGSPPRFGRSTREEPLPGLLAPRPGGGRSLFHYLMEHYGPATALVDELHEILHLSGGSARFMQLTEGEPTYNLLQLVRPILRMELRSALFAAATEAAEQVRVVAGMADSGASAVRLTVRPVPSGASEESRTYFLVQFEELPAEPLVSAALDTEESSRPVSQELSRRLEQENITLHQQLRATVEQYEALTEELKASNEELHATNEEMRSVAEELETGKEELQSVNEELSTVNYELKVRVDEVSHANSDLQNFLAATDIGTLFLDRELRIKRYTPMAETLFNLIPTDIGRPLTHLNSRLDYPLLPEDADTVLAHQTPVEREIPSRDGLHHFMARLLPYRSQEDRIEGVVLNFIDITQRKQAEEALRKSEERLRTLFDSMGEAFVIKEALRDDSGAIYDYRFIETNPAFTRHTGLVNPIGHTVNELLPGIDAIWSESYERVLRTGEPTHFEAYISPLNRWLGVSASRLGGGGSRRVAIVFQDITERKQALEAVARAKEELEQRVEERTQELMQMSQLRQALVRQLVNAQEAERARISRDLHDDTGQQVSTILLGLNNLKNSPTLSEDPDAQRLITQLEELATDVAKKSHRLAFTLRPTDLDDIGLMGALRTYTETWSQWSGLPIQVESVGMESSRLPREIETTIYRVVQEALTNILRHASPVPLGSPDMIEPSPERTAQHQEQSQRVATRVSLLVQRQGPTVLTIIEDDGPGFDVQAASQETQSQNRLGLFGMQERARLVGGTLEIESTHGRGTTLYLRLPSVQENPE